MEAFKYYLVYLNSKSDIYDVFDSLDDVKQHIKDKRLLPTDWTLIKGQYMKYREVFPTKNSIFAP